jgi:hypothetical protein
MTAPGRTGPRRPSRVGCVGCVGAARGGAAPRSWRHVLVSAALIALALAGRDGRSHAPSASHHGGGGRGDARVDRAQIRDVIRRFDAARLAADAGASCELVDPSKLRYLEQIGLPCEVSLGGTLTPESERDVRTSAITSIDIHGDRAVAHIRSAGGRRDLQLHRRGGHWLIVGV